MGDPSPLLLGGLTVIPGRPMVAKPTCEQSPTSPIKAPSRQQTTVSATTWAVVVEPVTSGGISRDSSSFSNQKRAPAVASRPSAKLTGTASPSTRVTTMRGIDGWTGFVSNQEPRSQPQTRLEEPLTVDFPGRLRVERR
ncbi:hypothetical protein PAXRUDRAFT_826527 [Paxillus rubicundulus Ve08.2h10]|uniref:Uncharacterized protein n=1 Tax=Paxillus rubicundulus Ve08.2h10 TaxID=930991 RepID=A0A0D0E490_9AGAM|nr:hypothetical protein PAXRUDRAFT_826527 [Paxillus rubicundulus Ve08.2h10]